MFAPRKRSTQEAAMSEAMKAMRQEVIRNRRNDGHKERVDAFNAALIAEMGKENCTCIILGYN